MTINELANVAGCNRDTVIDTVKREYPGLVQNGKTTRLNQVQAHHIMNLVPRRGNHINPVEKSSEYSIGHIIEQNSTALGMMMTMLSNMERRLDRMEMLGTPRSPGVYSAKYLPSKIEYYSIKGYLKLIGRTSSHAIAATYWRKCVAVSIEMGKDIQKVDDPNLTEINAYHIDVLKSVIGE